jgi:hypothetical protein
MRAVFDYCSVKSGVAGFDADIQHDTVVVHIFNIHVYKGAAGFFNLPVDAFDNHPFQGRAQHFLDPPYTG